MLQILQPLLIKWGLLYVALVCSLTGLLALGMPDNDRAPKQSARSSASSERYQYFKLSSANNDSQPSLITARSKVKPPKKPVQEKAKIKPAGNTYASGNCTWYAKSRRPDLPSNLGNADTWTYRAAAQGIPTGHKPKVGAIGQSGIHVVYVEKVKPDGSIIISEMNFEGLGVVSHRHLPADSFVYIY